MSTPAGDRVVSGETVAHNLMQGRHTLRAAQDHLEVLSDDGLGEAYLAVVGCASAATLTDPRERDAVVATFNNDILLEVRTRDRRHPVVPPRLEAFRDDALGRYPELKNEEFYRRVGLRMSGEVQLQP